MIDIVIKKKLNSLCLPVVQELLNVSCPKENFPFEENVKNYFSNYISNHRAKFINQVNRKDQQEALIYCRAKCLKIYQEDKIKYPLYLNFIAQEKERFAIINASLTEFNLFLEKNNNPHTLNYLTYDLISNNHLDKIILLSHQMQFDTHHCIHAVQNEKIFKYILEHSEVDITKILHEHIAYLNYELQCYLVDMGARLTALDEKTITSRHSQILDYEKSFLMKNQLLSQLPSKDNIKKTKI